MREKTKLFLCISKRIAEGVGVIVLYYDFCGSFGCVAEDTPDGTALVDAAGPRLGLVFGLLGALGAFLGGTRVGARLRLLAQDGWGTSSRLGGRSGSSAPLAKDPAAYFLRDARAGVGLVAIALAGASLLVRNAEHGAAEHAAISCLARQCAVRSGAPRNFWSDRSSKADICKAWR